MTTTPQILWALARRSLLISIGTKGLMGKPLMQTDSTQRDSTTWISMKTGREPRIQSACMRPTVSCVTTSSLRFLDIRSGQLDLPVPSWICMLAESDE
jgi:hypothetical protein